MNLATLSHLATEIASLYTRLKTKRHTHRVDLVEQSIEIPYASHHTVTPNCRGDTSSHVEGLCSRSLHPWGDGAHPFGTLTKYCIHLELKGRSSNDLACL